MKQRNPPRLANWILCRIIRSDLLEEVLGDLEEHFTSYLNRHSLFRSRINYWYQVMHMISIAIIGWQIIKIRRVNPIEYIRDE